MASQLLASFWLDTLGNGPILVGGLDNVTWNGTKGLVLSPLTINSTLQESFKV